MHPILISRRINTSAYVIILIVSNLLIAGCAGGLIAEVEERPVTGNSAETAIPSNPPIDPEYTSTPLDDRTYQIEQAERFSRLADSQVRSNDSIDASLSAAEFYIQANDANQALRTVSKLSQAPLNEIQLSRYHIILAYGDYAHEQYQLALDRLYLLMGTFVSAESNQQRVDALLLSSLCHQALNEYELAVTNLIERESLLFGSAKAETSRYIWQVINDLSIEQRQAVIETSSNPIVRNRFEQSLQGRVGDNSLPEMQFNQWRSQSEAAKELSISDSQWTAFAPKQIAILLPLSSRFNKAAQAVLDGIEYQHSLNDSPYRPTVSIYDVGSSPYQIGQYYAAAQSAGSDFIIGPLGMDYANQLNTANQGFQVVPTLMLGGDQRLSQNVARLSMSPEQQGKIVAERAFQRGFVNAAILASSDNSGKRTAEAFSRHWLRHGGKISSTVTFSPSQFDHSTELKQLFDLNQSQYRHDKLSRELGFRPKFAAYLRDDIDFIFMISDNKTGRIVRPQINFFSGATLPVMSSFSIYNGIQDPPNNLDLNLTSFPVMPWVLLSNDIAPYAGQLNMLFAMGTDAYQLAAEFQSMRNQPTKAIQGNMGVLNIESSGEVLYKPIWASFKDGIAESESKLTPLGPMAPNLITPGSRSGERSGTRSYDESNWDPGKSRRKSGF